MKKLLFIFVTLFAMYSCDSDNVLDNNDTGLPKTLKSTMNSYEVYYQNQQIVVSWNNPFGNGRAVSSISVGGLVRNCNSSSGFEIFNIAGSGRTYFDVYLNGSGYGQTITDFVNINSDGYGTSKFCEHNYEASRTGMYRFPNNHQNVEFLYSYSGYKEYKIVILWKDVQNISYYGYPIDLSQFRNVPNSELRIDNSLSYYLSTISTSVPGLFSNVSHQLQSEQLQIPVRMYINDCISYYEDHSNCKHYLEGYIKFPSNPDMGRNFEFSREIKNGR